MSKNIFNSVPMTSPGRNRFDLSHDVKASMSMGNLYPVMVQECVPGDKFYIGCETLIRFAPMLAPVMHRMDATVHYFFVPNRLVWSNWEKFITGGQVGDLEPVHPRIAVTKAIYDANPLFDYMGIPEIPTGLTLNVNAIPFAAYQLIYNEYYRDQNIIPELSVQLTDSDNTGNIDLQGLRVRAWMHDYFTGSLPFAQKGQAVDIPLGSVESRPVIRQSDTDTGIVTWNVTNDVPATVSANVATGDFSAYAEGQMFVQGASVEPTTINDLRRAIKLQEWLEKNARGGTRYTESNLVHFGVRSSDARLQRPEYITGLKTPVIISEVLNTTGETTGLPQGNMAGHGIAVQRGRYGSYYCEEHGFIIGIMSVLPITAYQQGLNRMWSRVDKLDYYWPSFANIGEQEVLNKELYVANDGDNDDVFGYVPRYAEYKYTPNRVAGQFKTTLNYWHMGRIFSNRPLLNVDFISADPTKRIFAVEGTPEDPVDPLYVHVYHKVSAIRLMPKWGVPSF